MPKPAHLISVSLTVPMLDPFLSGCVYTTLRQEETKSAPAPVPALAPPPQGVPDPAYVPRHDEPQGDTWGWTAPPGGRASGCLSNCPPVQQQ